MLSIEERFRAKYEVTRTGCWHWTAGRRTSTHGGAQYADFYFDGKSGYAHRFSYSFYVERIPDGLTIDHLCRNTLCVNPEHLEAVTGKVNILRGQSRSVTNLAKTHCDNGHPFDDGNTYVYEGARNCRACRASAVRLFRERTMRCQ